ncbi:MAG: pyridoxal-phosphate dependent enzyme [Gammaproteobacteria bacterium]|nr:pyridoxal-phosphate dependent enzyme [Gammaproteobacteria bacterium]
MKNKFNSILETIGNTPVVKISSIAPNNVNLYVKLESFNPGGSVKDRLALGVIEAAEKSGELKPGQTVVEATSGNTGIGLAVVCAKKGYPLVIVMAENFSIERRKLMRFLGAKVIITPAALKGSGMLAKAKELADTHGWFLTQQFENEANAAIHERTTAEEILRDFEGERLDYWVTGFGTGGTVNGVARRLKKERPETQIVLCEPDNSQLIGSGEKQPEWRGKGPTPSHPAFRPHAMQGWTPDFISSLAAEAVEKKHIDRLMPVSGADALALSKALAQKEGIFTGITGGASFAGALAIANEAGAGSNILCMLPDTGERYLTTPLFEDIDTEMNSDELAIAESTPNYRFDNLAIPQDEENEEEVEDPFPLTDAGIATMNKFLTDSDSPVVMFALEWCEFCWAARKLFKALDIPFVSVDLDSVSYAESGMGTQLRGALLDKLGTPTVPQIFITGEVIGGCTELFAANDDGSLKQLLERAEVQFDSEKNVIGADFLPNWVRKKD